MHNLTKIKIFRVLLWITYPVSLIFIYPFAALKQKKRGLYFFLDRYAIGGAQKVYLDILESVKDVPKTVYFTRKSPNDKLKNTFYSIPETDCHDIHFWCDNLLFRLFSVHYFCFITNSAASKVLSSNSTFFYDMLPFLKKNILKMELFHNFSYGNKGMEFFGLANYRYLDLRLLVDGATKQKIIDQYRSYKIPNTYDERLKVIEFGVDLPPAISKSDQPPLKILYAGRGSEQKRIWLLNRIAEHFLMDKQKVSFTFAGSMADELSQKVKEHSVVHGEIGEKLKMEELFRQSHAIILTSSFEGFPVVVKEGMSFGCVPIVTALPGNKIHLTHLSNALLIENVNDEDFVVNEAIRFIELLMQQPELLKKLSNNAHAYAQSHFGKEEFFKTYRQVLG